MIKKNNRMGRQINYAYRIKIPYLQHFILSSKSAFTTGNNAQLGTEQKWDANKENNKIRIYKHIKTGVGTGASAAHAYCELARTYLHQINSLSTATNSVLLAEPLGLHRSDKKR